MLILLLSLDSVYDYSGDLLAILGGTHSSR